MDMRPGFHEIVDGWMLVFDQEALADRIDKIRSFVLLHGDLSADEQSTADLMVQVFVCRLTGSEAIGKQYDFKTLTNTRGPA